MGGRTLEVQWMVNGPGGYVAHRLTLPLPDLLRVYTIIVIVYLAWKVGEYVGTAIRHAGFIR